MKKVLILLSTYNGEKYLREQLDSLLNQERVVIHILIRDDGSSDRTVDILREYAQDTNNKVTIYLEHNIGCADSFFTLIKYAIDFEESYDYYAFCDQDDVWMTDKLCSAVSKLEKSEAKYKLYFCNAQVVNSELRPIQVYKSKICNNLKGNIVSNHILGCTQVFNGNLLKLLSVYRPNSESEPPMHDAWTAIVAYSFNADVFFDIKPHIKYRQHGDNVVGAGKNFFEIMKKRISRYSDAKCLKSKKCELVLEIFADLIDEENKSVIEDCASYKHSLKTKVKLLSDKGFYQYGIAENIGLFFMILFNKF